MKSRKRKAELRKIIRRCLDLGNWTDKYRITDINDIGDELGCGAVLESLRRTKVGKFDVADAMAFDKLLETEMKDFALCVKPLSAILR